MQSGDFGRRTRQGGTVSETRQPHEGVRGCQDRQVRVRARDDLAPLLYLGLVISGFAGDEPAVGLIVLLLGAVGFIVYLALIRMTLELHVSIVRMSEDIHKRLPGG